MADKNGGNPMTLEKIGLEFERMIRLTEQGPELKLFGPAQAESLP